MLEEISEAVLKGLIYRANYRLRGKLLHAEEVNGHNLIQSFVKTFTNCFTDIETIASQSALSAGGRSFQVWRYLMYVNAFSFCF